MNDLIGNVLVVTGGGGAIGRTVARRLASHGAKVAILDTQDSSDLVDELRSSGTESLGLQVDVRDADQVDEAFIQVLEQLGPPDMVVTLAGVLRTARFMELTVEDWDDVFDTNVTGRFLVGQAAARSMRDRGVNGAIVNVGSFTGDRVAPGRLHYCASNGALDMLSRAMAIDLGPSIRVNTVSSGPVETPMIGGRAQDPERLERFLRQIPLRRLGRPEDIADAVTFLLSPDASYMTGATLHLEGGWLAG